MKEPQWSDTILVILYGLALASVPFTVWLCLIDWGRASIDLDDSSGTKIAHAPVTEESSSLAGWFWLTGAVASSVATLILLRRFRNDRQPSAHEAT